MSTEIESIEAVAEKLADACRTDGYGLRHAARPTSQATP